METPILTRLQKKLSLSGKKQKKEIMKNVVANPHQTYWPVICEELTIFVDLLAANLPRVRFKKMNVPWNILKDIPREDRRKARNDYIQKYNSPIDIEKEQNLIFGVNDVTKCLEKNFCSIVLVEDVTPRILVKHIIDLSIMNKVPILMIPGIRKILEESCGIKSVAVAIKKDRPEKSNLNKIVEVVIEISKKYPVDSGYINSQPSKQIEEMQKEDNINLLKIEVEKEIKESSKILGYHLYRTSLFERVFVPDMSKNTFLEKIPKVTDFLSFNTLQAKKSTDGSHDRKVLYKPLRVKRLKGNKNRHRDKIKRLRNKKN